MRDSKQGVKDGAGEDKGTGTQQSTVLEAYRHIGQWEENIDQNNYTEKKKRKSKGKKGTRQRGVVKTFRRQN